MSKRWRNLRVVALMGAAIVLFAFTPLRAHDPGNAFDDHWLAAACPVASSSPRVNHQVVTTDQGVAVQHLGRSTGPVVLHCNIDADDYHNWLQFVAEDNSATASVTVNLYRQDIVFGGSPELLQSLTTTDQPGVQTAELFIEPALEFDEFSYLYYLEIVLDRESRSDVVRIYHLSLRDVL